MTRYFIGDTKFGCYSAMKRRGFETVEEMNEVLISNWNKVVKAEDLVYLVGNFTGLFVDLDEIRELLKRLNGNVILMKSSSDHLPKELLRHEFKKVYTRYHYINDNWKVCCSMPRTIRPEDTKVYIHSSVMVYDSKSTPQSVSVHADLHNYTPMSEDEVLTELALASYFAGEL